MIPVDASNRDQAVRILAEAFSDDPVINWSCNNPESLVPFFEVTVPPFLPHGLSYLDPQQRGAAIWLGPQQAMQWDYNFATVARFLRLGGARGVYRMLRSGIATERLHPKEPHYYLFAIGALASCRGQGVGTALISHMLRTCDRDGVPAYLENSKQQNLPFYEGHGFEVREEIRFARSAPPVWLMWREPVSR